MLIRLQAFGRISLHDSMLSKNSAIGTYFANNTSIEHIDLTVFENVSSLPARWVDGDTSLKTVVLPLKLTATSSYFFSGNTSLQRVTFPQGFKNFAYFTISRCSSNVICDLPSSLTTIANNAVQSVGGSKVTYLLHSDVGSFDGLKNSSQINYIYVPDEYLSNYQTYLSGNASLSKLKALSEWAG